MGQYTLAHTCMDSYMIEKTDTHVHHGSRKRRPLPPQDTASIPAHKKANRKVDDDDDDDETKQSPKQSQRRSPKQGAWVPDHEIRPTDVLCGRHRESRAHAGNNYFRQLISANRAMYTSTPSRTEKTSIATQIVAQVVARGGRFLKRNDDDDDDAANPRSSWYQVDHTYAHDKVSHALRSARDLTNPRPRKKRKVVIFPPTDEEEALFRALYADQQQIFASINDEEEPITKAEAKTEATAMANIEAKVPKFIASEAKVDTGEDASPADPPMDLDALHSWVKEHPMIDEEDAV